MGRVQKKSGNFVRPVKWEPCESRNLLAAMFDRVTYIGPFYLHTILCTEIFCKIRALVFREFTINLASLII